jgi:ribulose-phosphate 3-epimerase
MNKVIISASILAADFSSLAKDCNKAFAAGVDAIHFDVMDHHFVPNLSFGSVVCSSLRRAGISAMIDVHLMVDDPDVYIEPFAKAGASMITFHPSTSSDIGQSIAKITAAGMQVGLAFNPDEPVDIDDALLKQLDLVLLMSVFPGFGGQRFIDSTLEKIKLLRQRISDLSVKAYLAVDGGIKADNAGAIIAAGADFLVVGSGLFKADSYVGVVNTIRGIG